MSKFCIYCGKMLNEEGICDCQFSNSKNNNEPKNKNSFEDTTNQHLFQNCFDLFINTLKSPVTTLKIFVKNNDFKAAIVMIIIESLSLSIFPIINHNFKSIHTNFDTGYVLYSVFSILLSLVVNFGMASITSLFTKLYMSFVCKKTITFKQGLCVAGAKSIGKIPFLLISIWLILIIKPFAFYVIFLGSIFGWVLAFNVIHLIIGDGNKDKSIYIGFLTFSSVYISWSLVLTLFPILGNLYAVFF